MIKLKKDGKGHKVENIISFDPVTDDLKNQAKEVGINLYHISEVIDAGKSVEAADPNYKFREPVPETVYMFCYTSGTTGDPKAAMLEHKTYLASASAAFYDQPGIDENSRTISYLPLAHSLE